MKTLTLWQPWASLVAFEEKQVETRSWSTKHRGLIAIHAAMKLPPPYLGASRFEGDFDKLVSVVAELHRWTEGCWWPGQRALGAILCTAELVDVIPTDQVRGDLSPQELLFGNYEDGRYAWFLENVKRFDSPITAKGNRMLWNWKEEREHGETKS